MSSADGSRDAAITAREIAEAEGVKTSISLSDPSMVEFFRESLQQILGNGVDHLFCNALIPFEYVFDRLSIMSSISFVF